jgi:head-tail adaptor
MFRPNEAAQMTTAMRLQTPVTRVSYGVSTNDYTDAKGVIMANFKSYGGTEKNDNGVLSIEDTAQVVCWYRPDIKSDCRLILLSAGFDDKGKPNAIYEILGEPENIEMRNMFLKFKVRRIKGGA